MPAAARNKRGRFIFPPLVAKSAGSPSSWRGPAAGIRYRGALPAVFICNTTHHVRFPPTTQHPSPILVEAQVDSPPEGACIGRIVVRVGARERTGSAGSNIRWAFVEQI